VRLFYASGILVVVGGLFNSDSIAYTNAGKESWHGAVHDLSGFISFALLTVATFFLRGVFARDAQWRRFTPHALMFAVVIVVTFVLTVEGPSDSFGVAQRVFVAVDLLWIGTLGCALIGTVPALPGQMGDRPPQ
jgi:hypothetical protein